MLPPALDTTMDDVASGWQDAPLLSLSLSLFKHWLHYYTLCVCVCVCVCVASCYYCYGVAENAEMENVEPETAERKIHGKC